MKPPFYYTMFAEYGLRHPEWMSCEIARGLSLQDIEIWREYARLNGQDERGQFVMDVVGWGIRGA